MTDRDPYILSRLAEHRAAVLLETARLRRGEPWAIGVRRATGRLLMALGIALVGDSPPVRNLLHSAPANR